MDRCAKVLILMWLVVTSSIAYAAPGDLDSVFGTGGVATYDSGNYDQSYDVAIQEDGKIIVAGTIRNGTDTDLAVLRFTSNGSLDTGFGIAGVATYDGGGEDRCGGVALQEDGRIIVAGSSDTGANFDLVVLRYSVDGVLDTDFGTSGVTLYDNGSNDFGYDVALQDDGKIIVAGQSRNVRDTDIVVLRYNDDGTLDTDFGTGGVATYDNGDDDFVTAVALQDDGKIVVSGGMGLVGENMDLLVLRFNNEGALDTDFGTGGVVTYDTVGAVCMGWSVVLQDDGKIVIAGNKWRVGASTFDHDIVVWRYNADGSLDTDFAADGVAIYDGGDNGEHSRAVTFQEDGRIIVAGAVDYKLGILRYNADGSLDTGFGTDGVVTYDSPAYFFNCFVALQADGRIVVAGASRNETDDDILVLRYNADGELDTDFGPGGDRGYAVALQNDGRIVVAGTRFNGTDDDLAVLRYDTDGALDTDFGVSGVATYDSGNTDYGYGAVIQNDGRIVVAGWSSNGTNWDLVVLRYNTDGSLDTDFGIGGVATYDNGISETAHGIVLQDDGRIVVAGASHDGHTDYNLLVLRFNTDGSLDTDFGIDGVATYDNGDYDAALTVALQHDGRIIVAGASSIGTNYNLAVLRFNTDGALDTDFGTSGVATYDSGNYDAGWAAALQDDGRIIVAGNSRIGADNDLVMLRFNTDGVLDTSFGIMGVAIYNSGQDDNPRAVTLQDDGRIIVAGHSDNGTDHDLTVLRYNASGALDIEFGTNGVATYDSGDDDYGHSVALQDDGRIVVAGYRYMGTGDNVLTVRFEGDETGGGGGGGGGCFISAGGRRE